MDRNNDLIMSNQLYSILVNLIIGIGVLSLPRSLADKAGPDSLIVLVVGSILFLILALIIERVVSKFPQKSIVEIGEILISKPIGKILGFLYFVYLLLVLVLQVRAFGEVSKNFLLLTTPIEVIMLSFLFTAVYIVRSGIESIARVSVIVLPISVFPALFTMLLALSEVDLTYFLPVMRTPILDLIKTIPEVFFSFLGYEFIFFIGFFVNDTKNIRRTSIWAIISVAAIYFVTVTITIGRFGIAETKNLVWPVVTVFKTIDIPGTLLENIEVVIMSTWLLSIFMTVSITYFGAVFLLSRVLDSREHNYLTLPLLPIIFSMTLIPENAATVYDFLGIFANIFGTVFAAIIPIFLLIISLFKNNPKKGLKKSE